MESALTFRQFMFNEGIQLHKTSDGRVQIIPVNEETVSVSGRLVTEKGDGIATARITLIDDQGVSRSAMTDQSGNYQFENVPVGESYQVQISAKGYTIPVQYLTVATELREVVFTAEP